MHTRTHQLRDCFESQYSCQSMLGNELGYGCIVRCVIMWSGHIVEDVTVGSNLDCNVQIEAWIVEGDESSHFLGLVQGGLEFHMGITKGG